MKVHQLVSGIGSGYIAKGIQLVVSLALVPFFLRADVLGIDGYGRAFTIASLIGLLPMLTEGLPFSFTRSISQALDRADGTPLSQVLGAGLKIVGVACGGLALLTVMLAPLLVPWVGLELSRDAVGALALSGLIYCIENLFQLLRAPAIARGAINFVNLVGAAEVVLRAAAYVALFTQTRATLTAYFGIQAVFTLGRCLAQVGYLARHWPSDLRGAWRAPWSLGRESIHYSWPITIQVGCQTVVHRVPIVLANRLLGEEAAGLAALAVQTIRNYVLHSLFAVLQPIALPLASRLDPRRLSASRAELLWRLEGVYVFVSGALVSVAAVCAPDLIRIWLGPDYDTLAAPAQAMLVACGIELAFTGRLSLLIGQGLLGAAVPGLLSATAVALGAAAIGVVAGSWQWAVYGVALYFPISTVLGVDAAFRREITRGLAQPPRSWPMLFLLASGAAAWLLGPHTAGTGWGLLALRAAAEVAVLVALAHFLLVPIGRGIHTLLTLRRSLGSNILAESSTPPDARP